jgi:hypothetical protein
MLTELIDSIGSSEITTPFGLKLPAKVAMKPFLPVMYFEIDRMNDEQCEGVRAIARKFLDG